MIYRTLFFLLFPMLCFCKTTISIIIPCYVTHAKYLENLLSCYATQTKIPDEVVVSLSSATPESDLIVSKLRKIRYPFTLNIISTLEKQTAGKNRNLACTLSRGDLLICQDADDIPHPQRVEVIAYLFKTHDFDHLLHSHLLTTTQSTNEQTLKALYESHFIPSQIKYSWVARNNIRMAGDKFPITNGNPAFKREVFNKVQWKDQGGIGEDIDFNRRVYGLFKKNLLINAKLYCYCNWASSFNE